MTGTSYSNSDNRNQHSVTVRKKFDIFLERSERHTPNDEYENFVIARIDLAAECIPTKLRTKRRVLGELEKNDQTGKKSSLFNKRNPTYANAQKFKKVQRERKGGRERERTITYQK